MSNLVGHLGDACAAFASLCEHAGAAVRHVLRHHGDRLVCWPGLQGSAEACRPRSWPVGACLLRGAVMGGRLCAIGLVLLLLLLQAGCQP